MATESQPFSTAFFVWLVAGGLSGLLFAVGVQHAHLPARGFAAIVGALICCASLVALTVMARNGLGPGASFGAAVIYTVGIVLSLAISLFYAFFFMFWHAKNF